MKASCPRRDGRGFGTVIACRWHPGQPASLGGAKEVFPCVWGVRWIARPHPRRLAV